MRPLTCGRYGDWSIFPEEPRGLPELEMPRSFKHSSTYTHQQTSEKVCNFDTKRNRRYHPSAAPSIIESALLISRSLAPS
jgi:hypothetical protein